MWGGGEEKSESKVPGSENMSRKETKKEGLKKERGRALHHSGTGVM